MNKRLNHYRNGMALTAEAVLGAYFADNATIYPDMASRAEFAKKMMYENRFTWENGEGENEEVCTKSTMGYTTE